MQSARQNLLNVFKLLTIVFIFFQICRVLFLFLNADYLQPIDSKYVVTSVLWGFFYDLSAIITWNSPVIALQLVQYAANKESLTKVKSAILITLNFCLLLINLADIEYFRFTNKRTTFELVSYSLSSFFEIFSSIPSHILNYGLLGVPAVVMAIVLYKLSALARQGNAETISTSRRHRILVSIIILLTLTALSYGIFDKDRLTSKTILRVIPVEYSVLALNTPFVLMESLLQTNANSQQYNWINNTQQIRQYENSETLQKPNVIILILEGFSKEYVSYFNSERTTTPFLDSLIKHSLVCSNAFANGRTTLEALPSIIASIPALEDRPFILSSEMKKPFESLAKVFDTLGYTTSFFYGARNGNLGIENFAKAAGFQQYVGLNEYEKDTRNVNDFDGVWGIYDDRFLQYFASRINGGRQPFFSCLLTLSSHPPYKTPDWFKTNTAENKHFESIEYTDFALRQFFRKISKEVWFKNTLFIITGDHTAIPYSDYYATRKGIFSIPIIYYASSDIELQGDYPHVTQQTDIMPSILHYIHYNAPMHAFGNSIFHSQDLHFAMMKFQGAFQFIDNDYTLGMFSDSIRYAYNTKKDTLLRFNMAPRIYSTTKSESDFKSLMKILEK